ncbi:hypothetical protein [Halobaculum magnesiiphilum]|uniref:Uncharacterized protein n=1 Tax=Halobaculum magnesiiphilum TaxID=1017351 RepID=A0A8T8WI38_9EURY|nr:hypothetical protein [Halobaculum magnesiiphilum]QZP39456.1 hypothetical protein K6T50_17900 [Halobaculum magnesiiphilum]
MPLRPVDRDVLEDISQDISQSNYGFLYVDRVRDDLKDQYQSREKGRLKAPKLSTSDVKESLRDLAEDENYSLERIRSGVFYWDPFGSGTRTGITERLKGVFRDQMVVTTEDLRKAFDLAHEDADFFAKQLRRQNLVMRIAAGSRDYYSVGSRLKEETGEDDLKGKLKRRATHGKLSHGQLEEAISVAATSDVIGYLQGEGLIIDMDGEYLVRSALDEFAEKLADDLGDDVSRAFEDAGNVMPTGEYDSLIESEIEVRSNVLAHVRSSGADIGKRDVIEAVREQYDDEDGDPHVEVLDARSLAVAVEPFDRMVEGRAEDLTRPLLQDLTATTADNLKQELREEIEDLHLTTSDAGNAYARTKVRERGEALIDERF